MIRNLSFYDDIAGSGSCTPTVCGALTHRSTTSERWFYNYGIFGNCTGGATETDTIIKWKKDVDGSTPVGGDFTSTQHYLFTDYPLNSISGNGALTGTVTGQEFKVYGPDGITLLATVFRYLELNGSFSFHLVLNVPVLRYILDMQKHLLPL